MNKITNIELLLVINPILNYVYQYKDADHDTYGLIISPKTLNKIINLVTDCYFNYCKKYGLENVRILLNQFNRVDCYSDWNCKLVLDICVSINDKETWFIEEFKIKDME